MLGAVKFEKDFAADLSALMDAVKLDLNVDFCFTARLGRCGNVCVRGTMESAAGDGDRKGWSSKQFSVGGEDTVFSVRTVKDFRLRYDGVDGALKLETVLCAASSEGASEGVEAIESLETEREDSNAASFSSSMPVSMPSSSFSVSSAGSNKTSNGDLKPSGDARPSSSLHS
jgi:hypothetical protein